MRRGWNHRISSGCDCATPCATNPYLQRQAQTQLFHKGTSPGSSRDDEPGGFVHPSSGGDSDHGPRFDVQHLLPIPQGAPMAAKTLLGGQGDRNWLRGQNQGTPIPSQIIPCHPKAFHPPGSTYLRCPQCPVSEEHPGSAVQHGHLASLQPEAREALSQRRGIEDLIDTQAPLAGLQLRLSRRPQHHQSRLPASHQSRHLALLPLPARTPPLSPGGN